MNLLEFYFYLIFKADFGNQLTPTSVQHYPLIEYDTQKDQLFTLLMIDFGASPATSVSKIHWLVVNIPGCNVRIGETQVEYLSPAPSKKGGYSRYLFLVYKQNDAIESNIKFISKSEMEGRYGFRLNDFTQKYNLGKPFAINFFVAKWDEFAETIIKSFGVSE